MEILDRSGNVLFEDQAKSVRATAEAAVRGGVSLERADFSGANLREADLRGANLFHADLSGADLHEANLRGARLEGAHLIKAKVLSADLSQADLRGADLSRAGLALANLTGADLFGANLHKANLIAANLTGAKLNEANLTGATLSEANLERADLWTVTWRADPRGGRSGPGEIKDDPPEVARVSFRHARMPYADLRGADLTETDFRDADLQHARLDETTALQTHRLGGADLSNAKLPVDVAGFDGLAVVKEASRNARKIFLAMLLACAYSVLTVLGTTDLALLTNSSAPVLPLITSGVPIVAFYTIAPVLITGMFVYFHLSMTRIWEGLAMLPAVFPDGTALDRKAYPWLLLGVARAHMPRLAGEMAQPAFTRMQLVAALALAWGAVPVTLYTFWVRALPAHSGTLSALHVFLLIVAIGGGLMFYRRARMTLRGGEATAARLKPLSFAVPTGTVVLFGLLGYGTVLALQGYRSEPWMQSLGYRPQVVLNPDLSGADLRGAVLNSADFGSVVLTGSDLSGADLSRADLSLANLRGANLGNADLRGANLLGADLVAADLRGANVFGAFADQLTMRDAMLSGATCPSAPDVRGDPHGIPVDEFIARCEIVIVEYSGSRSN